MRQLNKADVKQKEWEDDLQPHQHELCVSRVARDFLCHRGLRVLLTTISQRDNTKESQILIWIWNCLEMVSCLDYDQFLKDGVALCKLMNHVRPGSVNMEEVSSGNDFRQKRRNIELFLRAAKAHSGYSGPKLGEEPYDPVNAAAGRRRGGMPIGDDIYVAHVNVRDVIRRLPSLTEGEDVISVG
ncbi:hypothetical protein HPB52_011788 [Rhipicephalus sanguineus]|uniref:Calponin-homology (CH) domain-containing protein n=1 Tax=Rhipicephalus sanguineus TaxID=34632 RepID=A0A9D4PKK6_RHISA|nr:hypothetical protein HPB52_011788 [Rhipicephalus sanguineus]